LVFLAQICILINFFRSGDLWYNLICLRRFVNVVVKNHRSCLQLSRVSIEPLYRLKWILLIGVFHTVNKNGLRLCPSQMQVIKFLWLLLETLLGSERHRSLYSDCSTGSRPPLQTAALSSCILWNCICRILRLQTYTSYSFIS
jgi:hypothetical protein